VANEIGPLIGALFNSVTPKGQDKKRARKPKPNKTTLGEKAVTEPAQQHGEVASAKAPTETHRLKEEARYQKRRATEDWIAGRVTTQHHNQVHARANHVLSNKKPHEFKGKTGERAGKKGLW